MLTHNSRPREGCGLQCCPGGRSERCNCWYQQRRSKVLLGKVMRLIGQAMSTRRLMCTVS